MTKPDNSVFESLSETNLLALCIWAEARNQGLEGMQAVGSVILNRASRPGWWGRDIKSVILCPKQFSWTNADDASTTANEENPERSLCLKIAMNFIDSLDADLSLREAWWIAKGLLESAHLGGKKMIGSNVGSATYYHTTKCDPTWDDKMKKVCQVKDHVFYVG